MTDSVPPQFSDLTHAQVATLATIGPDGRPQLSAVWFLHVDGQFKLSLNIRRQKTKNLRANPAVNLFILDVQDQLRYLEVRGDAELAPDPGYEFAKQVSAKYGGIALPGMDGPEGQRVVVTVRPTRIVAVDKNGSQSAGHDGV